MAAAAVVSPAERAGGTESPRRGRVLARGVGDHNGRYVSVYSWGERLTVALLTLVWLAATVWFWMWWFDPAHWLSPAGLVATTTLLFMTFAAPAWLVIGIWRASRPLTRPHPDFRIAMIITRAPSEPFTIVRQGLRAMLDQQYPFEYDVWLADESPTPDITDWCQRQGVRISSREGVADYHRESWPRRTRCKEGNLAYFYDTWGYDNYDIVCQFDADHAPAPNYLWFVASAFVDRSVGYVAAPSICDVNGDASWAARGRVHAEAALHGPAQSGHVQELSPICFGSHYAVRTAALRRAGGLGPELAEDFTTTLALLAEGYTGAFAIDAVAHGEGPECIAHAVVQEQQWAGSMARVYLDVAPAMWNQLDLRSKVKMGFGMLWYPFLVAHMVLAHLLVFGAVLSGQAWVNVPIDQFVIHRLMPMFAVSALMAYARRLGLLRPTNAKVVSWESALLSLLRWPWVAIGVAEGVFGSLTGKHLTWRVTPKAAERPLPFYPRTFVPHHVLVAALLVLVGFFARSEAARGYSLLALGIVLLYLVAMVSAVLLHARENPGLALRAPLGTLAALATLLATAAGVAWYRWDDLFPVGAQSMVSGTGAISSDVWIFIVAVLAWALWMTTVGRRPRPAPVRTRTMREPHLQVEVA